MAGPLFGIGAQQQIPLTATTQQSQQASEQQKAREEGSAAPKPGDVQPQGTPSVESQQSETTNYNNSAFTLSQEEQQSAAEQGRGALLDVVV